VSAESTIILMVVAILLCVCGTTCCLFLCGCCKCLNNAGDESKYGLCNRFCPWMPCSDPPEKKEEAPSWMANPQSEEENRSSLFGRNPMLSAQVRASGRAGGSGGPQVLAVVAAGRAGWGQGAGLSARTAGACHGAVGGTASRLLSCHHFFALTPTCHITLNTPAPTPVPARAAIRAAVHARGRVGAAGGRRARADDARAVGGRRHAAAVGWRRLEQAEER
jgi:hypothetical protein